MNSTTARSPRPVAVLLATALLAGCASQPPAPVLDIGAGPMNAAVDTRPDSYTVRAGDTLYSIALNHGYGYRELARWNRIPNPDLIYVGQIIRLRPPAGESEDLPSAPGDGSTAVAVATPLEPYPAPMPSASPTPPPEVTRDVAAAPAPAPVLDPAPEATATPAATPHPVAGKYEWIWPVRGKVLSKFTTKTKGIDIGGTMGEPVHATAAGQVVYAGSGLRGYGNLVIIKHNKTYLSAYAHNRRLLVKEGDTIKQGQAVAELGETDTTSPRLHFEIRRFGKPIDPLKLLPAAP